MLLFVLFRDNVIGVLSVLLRRCWIMKSTANRCAFIRAEYVEILLLLLHWTSSYKMPESDVEEERDASQTVSEVTVDGGGTGVTAALNAADLQCLDEAVNGEVRLLLKVNGPEKPCETEVRVLHQCEGIETACCYSACLECVSLQDEENSSIFSLIHMRQLPSAMACGQLNFAATKSSMLSYIMAVKR